MSRGSRRLYMFTTSDSGSGTGKGANETCSAQINWGSSGNSKRAAKIEVYWPRGAEHPEVKVLVGEQENPIPTFCLDTDVHFYKKPIPDAEDFACGAV